MKEMPVFLVYSFLYTTHPGSVTTTIF